MPPWSATKGFTPACRGNLTGAADRAKALNLNTARLSNGATFQLKKHKLELCEKELKNIGLTAHEAKDAAKLMGGDLEMASEWHFESKNTCYLSDLYDCIFFMFVTYLTFYGHLDYTTPCRQEQTC